LVGDIHAEEDLLEAAIDLATSDELDRPLCALVGRT
jgi:hypothetical protein